MSLFRHPEKFTSENLVSINQAIAKLRPVPLYVDDTPTLTAAEIYARVRRHQQTAGESAFRVLMIDYLQLIQWPGEKPENRNYVIGAISHQIKQMARDLSLSVVLLSQLSRAPDQRNDHRPLLSDLRESGDIESDADVVAFLYREHVYEPKREGLRDVAELIIAKQRQGPTGIIKLSWCGPQTRFESWKSESSE